ncbi:hypothetical protein, conserved [Cyanidioschyzon merolae strain 10D]|jgi:hypothetical protein|uniref:Palmitoyltransferase n=1 Tax=Cyanidioschyzon merolae (strain NIES-3377 / 10D) TaxID=280699 RepID=M1V742_CYAM1|nr:hypothetical protein, conserved [Cyanidioschyzon merolae strain 10D]BAM82750.1 hypothetical protein, conserved [Cyanidioschyzon merolae strain 10D]|eukprot:XP_005538786.1 hypothetical protein, conserved [Cyanidioschyzon merolae strain 10D]
MLPKSRLQRYGPFAYPLVSGLTFCVLFLALDRDLPQKTFPYAAHWHIFCWQVVLFGALLSVSLRDPGTVTAAAVKSAAEREPRYDGVLYVAGVKCEFCGLGRLPRVSHSSVTDRCIECHDHYCLWVNNDIGRRNRPHFILFLFLHVCAVIHGFLISASALLDQIQRCGPPFEAFWTGSRRVDTQRLECMYFDEFFCVLSFSFLLCVVVYLFGFHLYLASKNMTFKEYYKWKAVLFAWKELQTTREGLEAPEPQDLIFETFPTLEFVDDSHRSMFQERDENLGDKHEHAKAADLVSSTHQSWPWNHRGAPPGTGLDLQDSNPPPVHFPYDRGSAWRNFCEVLCNAFERTSRL